jgi:rhamnosyltransferase
MTLATIVILTKNAEKYIQEILEVIFHQNVDFKYEVLVIDSGSKDRTLEILAFHPVRLITIPPGTFNHGETRNLGAREAHPESEFIVYLTQDATPQNEDWLKNLLHPFHKDLRVAGAYSRHVARPDATASVARQLVMYIQCGTTDRLVKRMPPNPQEYELNKFYYNFFSNTSSAIRRSIWEIIPFEKTDFAEDALWADKVIRNGYTTIYEPASIVNHTHSYSPLEQFRQNVDHSYAMNKLFSVPAYKSRRYWAKLFLGLPSQIYKDWKFTFNDPLFTGRSFWYKLSMLAYSPPWQFATVSGAFIGAHLDTMPRWLKLLVSRQERIKTKQ